jgi:glutathione S-transferase
MTLTIHGIARSRAFRNMWMAEELGLKWRHDPVGFDEKGIGSAKFRKINPMGQLPAITDGDLALSESLAINLYLAKKKGGPLCWKGDAEFGQAMMWTLFGATQIEPHAAQVMYNGNTPFSRPEAERDPKALAAALAALERPLARLDGALKKGKGFLVGGRFTAADVNAACCVMYLRFTPEHIGKHKAIAKWWKAIKARPAFVKAMKLRGE